MLCKRQGVDVVAFEEAPRTCSCFKGFAALFFRPPATLAELSNVAMDVMIPSSRAMKIRKPKTMS